MQNQDAIPMPPGFNNLAEVKAPVSASEIDGFFLIYDPRRKLGCIWRPEPGLWTAFTPVTVEAFSHAALAMIREQEGAEAITADALKRMMH